MCYVELFQNCIVRDDDNEAVFNHLLKSVGTLSTIFTGQAYLRPKNVSVFLFVCVCVCVCVVAPASSAAEAHSAW